MTMKTEALWQPAGQQQVYRHILQAMAYPGRIAALSGQDDAARQVLATLLDGDVSLCDRDDLLDPADWPLLAARRAAAADADYLVAHAARHPDFSPRLGTLTEPEQSATLLLRVAALGQGDLRLRLAGPGIDSTLELSIAGLHPDWLARRAEWVATFPLGVDLILVDDRQITALPRTTQVEIC